MVPIDVNECQMMWNGAKCSSMEWWWMVPISARWCWMGHDGAIWFKMFLIVTNGTNVFLMVWTGAKWCQLEPISAERCRIVLNSDILRQIVSNGKNGLEWCWMLQNCDQFCQIIIIHLHQMSKILTFWNPLRLSKTIKDQRDLLRLANTICIETFREQHWPVTHILTFWNWLRLSKTIQDQRDLLRLANTIHIGTLRERHWPVKHLLSPIQAYQKPPKPPRPPITCEDLPWPAKVLWDPFRPIKTCLDLHRPADTF